MAGAESNSGKGAVLYDYLFCRGGAERVALTLAQNIPDVDLCVAFRNAEAFSDDDLQEISLIDLHVGTALPGWRLVKGGRAFQRNTKFLSAYDWIVYSGSIAPLAIASHSAGANIYYCHTTPRFIYDLSDFYRRRMARWKRPGLEAVKWYLRGRYQRAIDKMDTIVANSINVKKRIADYLGHEATVVNPPCDVEKYQWRGQGGYYLSTARLEPYKRVDYVVRAFLAMPDKQLIVASGGSQLSRLERLAADADNIIFLDWVNDKKMQELVGQCIATIYIPKDEDFGMSPVESMAAGKPVIGVAEGGLLETVIDGETGLLLRQDPSEEEIIEAVLRMTPDSALQMRGACELRAYKYRREIFIEKMRSIIENSQS